ncbi:MAG TPA: DNA primase [Micromonosporaceae bacterium]|nr:DNA primase [Micromonosporaceae bacterium]
MTQTLEAAALRYAANGLPVFILGRSKRPVANCPACALDDPGHESQTCACLTCHGLYAATVDPQRIAAMFRVVPGGLLAIRTGNASRLVVIDVDPAHGGLDSLSALVGRRLAPPTAHVRTGSGGLHLYYRHPGGNLPCSQGRLGPGIDVRGDGGYVVAPPSIHPTTGKPYRWIGTSRVAEMPPTLTFACLPAPRPPKMWPPGSPAHTRPARGITAPDRLLAALLDTVRRAPVGTRRTTLYGAARGVARMVAAGAISRADALAALSEAGRGAEQTERDIAAAIRGGFHGEGVNL